MANRNKTAIVILALLLFALTAFWVQGGYSTQAETIIHNVIISFETPLMTWVMITISEIGNVFVISLALIILLLVPKTQKSFGMPLAITATATTVLNYLLKVCFMRTRPDIYPIVTELGYSFPSGHSMTNMAIYAMLIMLVWTSTEKKGLRLTAASLSSLVVFLIGFSRIYLGVHYAGDVLGGWFMGLAFALVLFRIFQALSDPLLRHM